MTDDELLSGFEACTLPNSGFRHAEHVRVAWIYLGRMPLPEALGRFAANLRRFAAAHGKPELYHETITVAFVLLIQDRAARRGRGASWAEFAAANPDLLAWRPSILDRHYSRELLDSPLARASFVWPDAGTSAPGT